MTTVSGHITRTLLSLSDLAIGPGTPYRMLYQPGLDPGTVVRRRETATSPYVHGAAEIGSVLDRPSMSVLINVTGVNQSTIATNVAALINAVSQQTFTFEVDLDSAVYSWTCYAADYGIGFPTQLLIGLQCPVTLSIPRDPIPVSGPV